MGEAYLSGVVPAQGLPTEDLPAGIALTSATRLHHVDILTPSTAAKNPGLEPTNIAMGTVVGLSFDRTTDKAYRIMKIQSDFVSDPSFHIHWTKNGNTDQSGKVVRWRLTYKVFNGSSEDVVSGAQTITWDETYVDAGLATRIVYRSPNAAAAGFVAGYYVGFAVDYVAANTTLTVPPVLVSADLMYRATINLGN